MDVGKLIFIIDEKGKNRPHICVCTFTNNAGVAYDWLVLPITSNKTVGDKNLIEVVHKKLKKPSYAKLNNLRTVKMTDEMDIHEVSFSDTCVEKIKSRLIEVFKVFK